MAKVKFFIRTTKKNKLANIRVRFYQGRKFDLTANIEKLILPVNWNNKNGKVRLKADFLDGPELQNDLDKLSNFILNDYNHIKDVGKIDKEWLQLSIKKFYDPNIVAQKGISLFDYIETFVKNADKRLNPNTGNPITYKMQREYSVTFEYLKEFAKKYGEPDFDDIDMKFYHQFVALLSEAGLKKNTIGKKIQTLKVFLNEAKQDGINHSEKYRNKKFKTIQEESENIYLSEDEINKLYKKDFSSKPSLERVRDLFVVGCWTGLRFADLKQISTDKINNNLLEIVPFKTERKVVIPIHPLVNEVLQKYNGKLPKLISNQKFNDYLKDAAKATKLNRTVVTTSTIKGKRTESVDLLHELITSHTARRSFCTNNYLKGIPTISIMAISGHKTESAFLKYIKVSQEEHAKKMMEFWGN